MVNYWGQRWNTSNNTQNPIIWGKVHFTQHMRPLLCSTMVTSRNTHATQSYGTNTRARLRNRVLVVSPALKWIKLLICTHSCSWHCSCLTHIALNPFHCVGTSFSQLHWAFSSQQPTAETLIWRAGLGMLKPLCQKKPEMVGISNPTMGVALSHSQTHNLQRPNLYSRAPLVESNWSYLHYRT